MNKLMMKARAGVTLVELLVVILIVTILSVSMLPLLQPFVTESQYAAEAIPVIANLRTKIGVFQYEKGHLPYTSNYLDVHTWSKGVTTSTKDKDGNVTKTTDTEQFGPTYYTLSTDSDAKIGTDITSHIGTLIDVDYQDLKGKRSKPNHYQYYPISATNNLSYVVACFGDGDGLKAGTGYAVCELNFTKAQKKYIGTWKRYKPADDSAGAIKFGTDAGTDPSVKLTYCYIPDASTFAQVEQTSADAVAQVIANFKNSGWEFD